MTVSRTMISALLLTMAAIIAWAGVFVFSSRIAELSEQGITAAIDQEKDSLKQTTALRLRAIARDTADARTKLDTFLATDVVKMLDTLDMVGEDAGVKLTIGQAQVMPSDGGLRSVAFVVNAEGSFDAVMHAAELVTTLPLPSVVDLYQFERLPGADAKWRLGARVRFITSEEIVL